MKLPYVVRLCAETLSRAAYLITGPRIRHFKQHLSFLLLPCRLQQRGINRPICTQIVNHYPDPWPISRVCWQRLQFTKVVYYFAWPLTVWFSLWTTRCTSRHGSRWKPDLRVPVREPSPAGASADAHRPTHLSGTRSDRHPGNRWANPTFVDPLFWHHRSGWFCTQNSSVPATRQQQEHVIN